MHIAIFRIIWPYVLRHLAARAAEYVNQRREQRLQQGEELAKPDEHPMVPAECPPCPPCPESSPAAGPLLCNNKIWFAASGLLLGSAFALMAYLFIKNSD